MNTFSSSWQQVPSWMRFGLSIARVQKPLVTSGELSPNEMENISKFGYICIIVAAVAFFEMHFFLRYAIDMPSKYSYLISALWALVVFNIDRGLFRDELSKARIRMAVIVIATCVFSIGFSVMVSDHPITAVITEENRALNEKIDKALKANLKPYQERYDKALADQGEVSYGIIKNGKASEIISQINALQIELAKYAGDTTRVGKQRARQLQNAIYAMNQASKQQGTTESGLRDVHKVSVEKTRIELDSQTAKYERAVSLQRVPADYSQANKAITLIRNFFSVGYLHVALAFLIAFIEALPLMLRYNYRDYDAVHLMVGLGNTPVKRIEERITTIRDEMEEARRGMRESRTSQTSTEPPNPFAEVF